MENTFTAVKKGKHSYKSGIKIVKNEINTNFKFYVPGCDRDNVNTYTNAIINPTTNSNINTMNRSIEAISNSICGGNAHVNQNEMLISYMKEIIKMNERLNEEVKALKNEQRKCSCKCNCSKYTTNNNNNNNSNCFYNKLSNYNHTQSYNQIAMMNIRKKFHDYYTKHRTPNIINNKQYHSTQFHKKKYITTKTANVSNRKPLSFNVDTGHDRSGSNNVLNINTLTTPSQNFISGMNSSLNSSVHHDSSSFKLKKQFATHIKHISDLHKSCDDLTARMRLNVSKDKVRKREKDLNDFMKYTESLLGSNSTTKYQTEKINIVEEYEGDNAVSGNDKDGIRKVMFSQPHSKSEERIKIVENESYYDNDTDNNEPINEDDGEIKIVGSDVVYKKQIIHK